MSDKFVIDVVLIALLAIIGGFHIARGIEYFDAMAAMATDMRSAPASFPGGPSVFSSLPPQNRFNAAWKYSAPFQSACLSPSCTSGCGQGQKITCNLTPHNQRSCFWR